ncbi:MAG: phosphatase PAP2 family protein [Actinomycetota bacterium]|nr:phosphatase PAP2 family protein [Actinomycetota bacterium]
MSANRGLLIATALAAVGVYLLMWVGYAGQWAWLAALDDAALQPLARFGDTHPGWVTAWNVFCAVLGPAVFRVVTLVLIVVALLRRRFRVGLFLLLTVELSAVVTEIAKALADRPRPDTALVTAYGLSFPSGHALGVTVAVLALYVVARPALGQRRRAAALAVGLIVIVAIGVGRVVLNVHHPSDVIAGWALGYAYVVACLLAVPPAGRPVRQPDGTPATSGSAR